MWWNKNTKFEVTRDSVPKKRVGNVAESNIKCLNTIPDSVTIHFISAFSRSFIYLSSFDLIV